MLNNRTGNNRSHRLKAVDKVTGWEDKVTGWVGPPTLPPSSSYPSQAECDIGLALPIYLRVANLESLRHRDTLCLHTSF